MWAWIGFEVNKKVKAIWAAAESIFHYTQTMNIQSHVRTLFVSSSRSRYNGDIFSSFYFLFITVEQQEQLVEVSFSTTPAISHNNNSDSHTQFNCSFQSFAVNRVISLLKCYAIQMHSFYFETIIENNYPKNVTLYEIKATTVLRTPSVT